MKILFMTFLEMSFTASYVIIILILIRMLLQKFPKIITYALWSVLAFRLLIPVSIESSASIVPKPITDTFQALPYQEQIRPQGLSNDNKDPLDFSLEYSTLPTQTVEKPQETFDYISLASRVWLLGVGVLYIYSFLSMIILKNKLKDSKHLKENIYQLQHFKTPFVFGFIHPKIYMPKNLSDIEQALIVQHERRHIQRKDHWIKYIGFLIASLHWFNPLVWLAYKLMITDMELSCDESVYKKLSSETKKTYAYTLLSLSSEKSFLNAGPLAFVESNTKTRIKNILNYKRKSFWIVCFIIILTTALFWGLFTNPQAKNSKDSTLEMGRYMTADGYVWLDLKKDQSFVIERSYATTYLPTSYSLKGHYEVIDQALILSLENKDTDALYFSIEDHQIIFQSGPPVIDFLQAETLFTYRETGFDYPPMISFQNFLYFDTGIIHENMNHTWHEISQTQELWPQTNPMKFGENHYISNTLPKGSIIYGQGQNLSSLYVLHEGLYLEYELKDQAPIEPKNLRALSAYYNNITRLNFDFLSTLLFKTKKEFLDLYGPPNEEIHDYSDYLEGSIYTLSYDFAVATFIPSFTTDDYIMTSLRIHDASFKGPYNIQVNDHVQVIFDHFPKLIYDEAYIYSVFKNGLFSDQKDSFKDLIYLSEDLKDIAYITYNDSGEIKKISYILNWETGGYSKLEFTINKEIITEILVDVGHM